MPPGVGDPCEPRWDETLGASITRLRPILPVSLEGG